MKWDLVYFDDQIQNIECLREFLSEKFNVHGYHDATAYPKVLQDHLPHAILLDVHMPVIDGHELYKKITEHPLYNGCPIIFISGDQSDENKMKSYEEGGVDFLARSLKSDEIVLRLINKIKFHLQRATSLGLGNLVIDLESMKAKIDGHSVDLTLLELRMMSNILRSYPEPISRHDLISKVWGMDVVKPGTISTHLTNLKPKIDKWDHFVRVRDDNLYILKKEDEF
jgi:DNA-binding response OmpR family regulator